MAKVTKKVVYRHDYDIGEFVQVKCGDLLLKGLLYFIQGKVTDKRGSAQAWIDLRGYGNGLSKDLMSKLPKKQELFTFWNPGEDYMDPLYLYAVEFLDIEHIPKKRRK